MSIDKGQLRQLIINTLREIKLCSPAAVNLLMGTAAQESHLGKYIKQIQGPAVGIFQMEPATHDDIWLNYINYRNGLSGKIKEKCNMIWCDSNDLEYNLKYAIVMCRLHYRRVTERLPPAHNVHAQSLYWKRYYNTEMGKGATIEFVENYERFVR